MVVIFRQDLSLTCGETKKVPNTQVRRKGLAANGGLLLIFWRDSLVNLSAPLSKSKGGLIFRSPGHSPGRLMGVRANRQPILADFQPLSMLEAICHSALNLCCSATYVD